VLITANNAVISYVTFCRLCTEDPVKSLGTIAHSVRLQGFGLVSYKLRAHIAGTASNRSGHDRYIYSGSQRVCTILIRCFSVPSGSEALWSQDF